MKKQHNIFISVHDQDLILQLEQNNIFRYLKDYKYLFLGNRPVDKLESIMDKVIVARNLPDNIEHQSSLFDYTGWYALAKNNLIKSNYVAIIHYDCLIFKDFEKSLLRKYKSDYSFVSFLPCPIEQAVYFSPVFSNTLVKAVKEIYNIDAHAVITKSIKQNKKYWATGGSFACSKKWLEQYIDWIEPMKEILLQDPMASHNIERTSKLFNSINNIKEVYLPDKLWHICNAAHNQVYQVEEKKEEQRKLFHKYITGKLYRYITEFSILDKIKILMFYIFS